MSVPATADLSGLMQPVTQVVLGNARLHEPARAYRRAPLSEPPRKHRHAPPPARAAFCGLVGMPLNWREGVALRATRPAPNGINAPFWRAL